MWRLNSKVQRYIGLFFFCTILFYGAASTYYVEAASYNKNDTNRQIVNEKTVSKHEEEAYIPKGTKLFFRLQKDIIANKVTEGDEVPLILLGDVRINGITIIENHTAAYGVVEKAVHSGVYGRSGQLVIALRSLKTHNGVVVPLIGSEQTQVSNHDNALLFGLIGGLFFKGAQANYRHGKVFTATVAKDTWLGIDINDLAKLKQEKIKE